MLSICACHGLGFLEPYLWSLVKAAFTLLEVLVVFAVLAVLVAIAVPATSRMSAYSARMKSISNLRQIGVASRLYANDHEQQLPGQPASLLGLPGIPAPQSSADEWPALFCTYLSPSDPRVFLDPSDPVTAKLPLAAVLSNTVNNTGYVYNGFDDLGVDSQPVPAVALTRLETPSDVVLLSQKTQGATAFFVNLLFDPLGDLFSLLNPQAYDGGSHYLFVDGSVRFIKQTDYSNNLWLVNKTLSLPTPGSSQTRLVQNGPVCSFSGP